MDLVRVLGGLDTDAAPVADSNPKACGATAAVVVAAPGA
jgi:hypothetical protein